MKSILAVVCAMVLASTSDAGDGILGRLFRPRPVVTPTKPLSVWSLTGTHPKTITPTLDKCPCCPGGKCPVK